MPPKLLLLLDWDSTLTAHDTLCTLASIGYNLSRSSKPRSWPEIVDAYQVDYREHEASYKPAKDDRKSVVSELEWLSSLAQVERQSFLRFKSQGLFENVSTEQIQIEAGNFVQGGHVQLRPGWSDLLAIASSMSAVSAIISVNWSSVFIRGCLIEEAKAADVVELVDEMAIHANEIGSNVNGDEPSIVTGEDKLRVLQEISASNPAHIVVYVGDSTSDLHCLLAAGLGIVVRDVSTTSAQQDLIETLSRISVPIAPLKQFKSPGENVDVQASKALWWTSDLADITQVLSRLVH
jgi:2-hydroxy-3-keto-5-methylthiopentenyl-1-phosphate phosphatase